MSRKPIATPAVEEVRRRPRIKAIEICDFRAFPGPTPVKIELGGLNLFLYGENGVGKSTIFHALDGMFTYGQSKEELAKLLADEANRFTPEGDQGQARVSVTYNDDQAPAVWSSAGHPIDTQPGPSDPRIVNAAWAKAILDYRSLLHTNYDHGDEINLFEVCVESLLRDYAVAGGDRLGDVWRRLSDMLERGQIRDAQLEQINLDSRLFNDGLAEALGQVLPLINPMLDDLGSKPNQGLEASGQIMIPTL